LLERLSQTLAGRVSLLSLLPFSIEELRGTPWAASSLEPLLLQGLYPRIYDQRLAPLDWYPAYIQTYLERDVRLVKNVGDLMTFQRFVRLCAGRTGSLLNLSSLAQDAGITHNTAKAWISILEASFLVFLLRPHHQNFNKRLVKMPKLYFYDTGLACALLGIETTAQLETHPWRGHLFETLVVSELLKRRLNCGLPQNLSFWRDKTGHEIDCLVHHGSDSVPIDIYSGRTLTEEALKNLQYWNRLARRTHRPSFVIYAGDQDQSRHSISILGWKALEALPAAL
jgi:predicted AAA+ superfamily ATPase